jgi:hypothetical protein
MQPIVVRQATADDLETLNRFQQGVIATERPFEPTIKDNPVRYYDISRMLGSDDVRFVIAESGPLMVGCGFARIEFSKPYLKHRIQGYLGLMYVDLAYRGHSHVSEGGVSTVVFGNALGAVCRSTLIGMICRRLAWRCWDLRMRRVPT